jgi:hypothetical protein
MRRGLLLMAVILTALLSACCYTARAAKARGAATLPHHSFEGFWQGTLNTGAHPGGTRLRLVFKIHKQADGTLTGTLDRIDQGAKDIPLSAVSVHGSAASLADQTLPPHSPSRGSDPAHIIVRRDVEDAPVVTPVAVGGVLAGVDAAEKRAIGGEDEDPAGARGEQVTVSIQFQAVRKTGQLVHQRRGIGEDTAPSERAVGFHRERHPDRPVRV